ncbi:hypothetical protein ACJ9E6_001515 [Providencia rettgeri]
MYTYDNINTPTLPNCEATLKINISDNRSDLKGFYLLSVLPNQKKPGQSSVIMNGSVNNNGKNYAISRKFLLKNVYQGDHFFLRIENISIDPADQAKKEANIRGMPQLGQIYYLKIKQLSEKNYIFEENYAPLFICTV